MTNMFEEKKRKQETINTAMSKIKHVIAVASGKGGVGKSTVAANIAISLAKNSETISAWDTVRKTNFRLWTISIPTKHTKISGC